MLYSSFFIKKLIYAFYAINLSFLKEKLIKNVKNTKNANLQRGSSLKSAFHFLITNLSVRKTNIARQIGA